jgi:APA family basic amino acid/polyamine antiporter
LMPLVFIAAYIFVAISIAIDTPRYAMIGIGSIAAFMLIYFIMVRRKKKNS